MSAIGRDKTHVARSRHARRMLGAVRRVYNLYDRVCRWRHGSCVVPIFYMCMFAASHNETDGIQFSWLLLTASSLWSLCTTPSFRAAQASTLALTYTALCTHQIEPTHLMYALVTFVYASHVVAFPRMRPGQKVLLVMRLISIGYILYSLLAHHRRAVHHHTVCLLLGTLSLLLVRDALRRFTPALRNSLVGSSSSASHVAFALCVRAYQQE